MPHPSPYREVLGEAWSRLPSEVRAMHPGRRAVAQGQAEIAGGSNPLARLAVRLFGLPRPAQDTPLTVEFEPDAGGETWTRRFGGQTMTSRQWAGAGHEQGLLCEAVGPLVFASDLLVAPRCLILALRRWRLFGLPLPLWLAPRVRASERVEGGRFCFDVAIEHPLVGLIVRYRGWLTAPVLEPALEAAS